MAYNLQSLITILQQILNPEQKHWILDHQSKTQLKSLLEKVVFLKQIHENSSAAEIESLESQIRDAVHKAEDIIESHMVDQTDSRPGCASHAFSTPDLQQVTKEFDSILKGKKCSTSTPDDLQRAAVREFEAVKLTEGDKMPAGSSRSAKPIREVGLDGDLRQLKDRLTRQGSEREIVPIVGMGGIGKTTLAQKLYDDKFIVSHFDIRAWVTISQDYDVRTILITLLESINGSVNNELKDNKLKQLLHQSLSSRRYLIILDDIWSKECWESIMQFFPEDHNGSQIVLTTRESDVAKYAGSNSESLHQMSFLKKSESWNLLCQIVFREENCPDALEGIGRKIVDYCQGLPLAINVVGGILSNVKRSRDVWGNIANKVRAAIVETDEQFSNILSLSYNHLPHHLKPCFLYMGAFPEDYKIKASRLIHMLVAEGFVKSNGEKSLEEEARDYLKALMERNLVFVRQKKPDGKPKSYGMHDLLRDLCMKKADEEMFIHVKNGLVEKSTFSNLRRVSVHTSYRMKDLYASEEFMPLARSFLCTGLTSRVILSPIFFGLRLLRVLHVMEMNFQEFPIEILQLVNLRYLAFSCNSDFPSGISRLRNLQTLIGRTKKVHVQNEILEMPELRHIKLGALIFIKDDDTNHFLRENLQTISFLSLSPSLIERGFFQSIPNIKNLGIFCHILPSSPVEFIHLHKLETLRCYSTFTDTLDKKPYCFLPKLMLPCNIRKVILFDCVIFPSFMTTLCALPYLEILKIAGCVFASEGTNEEWEVPEEDEFESLKFLLLERMKLVHWIADDKNFPKLWHLVIGHCSALEEIPRSIGEIPTLEVIEVFKCSPSAEASAKEILEVQQSDFNNHDLRVYINGRIPV